MLVELVVCVMVGGDVDMDVFVLLLGWLVECVFG